MGWDKGFGDGWDAATKYMREEAEKQERAARAERHPPPPPPSGTPTLLGSTLSSAPTANELVLEFISTHPGMRGVEIANEFSKSMFPLPERTVRTALHRLKKGTKITIVDGKWYTPDAVPLPQLELEVAR